MKTIEERVDEWLYRTIPVTPEGFKQRLEGALTELADDLNAEKEKEVAELKEKLAAIEAGSDVQNLSVSSHFELDCGPIKAEPALLDEVKRVLGIIVHEETPECRCDTCRFVRARSQLLTRLGGSHE